KSRLLPPLADGTLDVAILTVDADSTASADFCDLPFGSVGDLQRAQRGDPVFPVGYPNGVSWAMAMTPDRLSQVLPTEVSFESQTIRVGYSGGVLLDDGGAILGMITADEPPFGRAVPINSIL